MIGELHRELSIYCIVQLLQNFVLHSFAVLGPLSITDDYFKVACSKTGRTALTQALLLFYVPCALVIIGDTFRRSWFTPNHGLATARAQLPIEITTCKLLNEANSSSSPLQIFRTNGVVQWDYTKFFFVSWKRFSHVQRIFRELFSVA